METVFPTRRSPRGSNPSTFHENFRWFTGLTPTGCRELRDAEKFEIALPADFSLPHLRHALSRDVESASERLDGDEYTLATTLSGRPALLRMRLSPGAIAVACPSGAAVEAHGIVARLLGLGQDVAAFDRVARKLGFAALAEAGTNLRISQTPTIFEGLLWAIIGQQIHLAFACRLKRRLFELCGEPAGEGLIACPLPEAVARLEPTQLLPLQFSRQKAGYLITAARLVTEGKLNLDVLPELSVPRVERRLLAVRGLGPWSVHFLMLRSLGFADCVPLGDTGVTSGLQRLMYLDVRPDVDATRRLMAVFSPHRSLATAHLWQLNRTPSIP
jgi:AraC family transcriptional regulator of adaptative response / DNA-3-methyladenine glycosylase II